MPVSRPHRVNKQITINAGVPVRIIDANSANPVMAERLFIQARSANNSAGIIYILDGVPLDTALNAGDASQLTAEIHTGDSYGDPPGGAGGWNQTSPTDLRYMGIDGTVTGDVVIVSYVLR